MEWCRLTWQQITTSWHYQWKSLRHLSRYRVEGLLWWALAWQIGLCLGVGSYRWMVNQGREARRNAGLIQLMQDANYAARLTQATYESLQQTALWNAVSSQTYIDMHNQVQGLEQAVHQMELKWGTCPPETPSLEAPAVTP